MIYEVAENYQIRPYQNGLCYEVWKYRPVKKRGTTEEPLEWVSMEKYPSTFGQALQIVYTDLMRNAPGEAKGLKAAIKRAEEIEQRIMDFEVVE